MKTHRSPLWTALSSMGRALLILSLGSTLVGLTSLAFADDAEDAAKTTSSGTRVYTNRDLAKYQDEDDRNRKQLKEPLPSQSAPVRGGSSDGDWSFVLAMIDREHEAAARSRAAADAAAAAYEADHQPEPEDIYGYAPYWGYGYFGHGCVGGHCNDGCKDGPFTHRSNCTPQPTNTMRPLDERGIRTPNQLWREARRNSAIHRAQVMPRTQGIVTVPRATVTPHGKR